jgi:hypothetical protein
MGGLDPAISTAENYREWAHEARGRSPAYDLLATLVADDGTILQFLGTLPPDKRQPNLLFDRYSYDYAGHMIAGSDPDAPTLRCVPHGPVPLPERLPATAWRAGLDLNPLDVTDDDDVRWLSCLVWPGEEDRQERLAAAVASARRDPPAVHRGDLLTDRRARRVGAVAGRLTPVQAVPCRSTGMPPAGQGGSRQHGPDDERWPRSRSWPRFPVAGGVVHQLSILGGGPEGVARTVCELCLNPRHRLRVRRAALSATMM